MHLTAFNNSLLLPENRPAHQISQEARGFVHCLLPGLSITLKLQTCPKSKRALPQHSTSGLGNSLCILLDKQVNHKNCQEEFILELPLKKEEF